MREIENLHHKTIALIFVILFATITVLVLRQDTEEAGKKDPAPVSVVKEGEFFKVGKYGNTIILDVQTERTNGKLEKQDDKAGKETRFLNGSQGKKRS
jgi:hypothetical protein